MKKFFKVLGNIIFYGLCLLLLLVLAGQMGVLPFRVFTISTGSMIPAFYPGDVAVIRVGSGLDVQPGDVILFSTGGERVLHRVVQVQDGQITTRGDANQEPDRGTRSRAEGKLLFTLPKLGYAVAAIQSLFSARAG